MPGRRPAQHPAPAPRPHRQPIARPGLDAGSRASDRRHLERQLAAQDDDGADVLQRRREAQLTDQCGTSFGRFERDVADAAGCRRRAGPAATTRARISNGSKSNGHRPMSPDPTGGRGREARWQHIGRVGHGPPEHDDRQAGRQPRAQPRPGSEERHAVAQGRGREPEHDTGGDPGQLLAGQPVLSARSPAAPPTTAPPRRGRSGAGAAPAPAGPAPRSTGASSTCRMSARSSASGPPRLPERRPDGDGCSHDAPDPGRTALPHHFERVAGRPGRRRC